MQDHLDGANSSNNALWPVRTSTVPRQFENFVVTEPLPARDDDNLRRIDVECVDRMEQEFSNRFSNENTILWPSWNLCYRHQLTTWMAIIWSLSLNMHSKCKIVKRKLIVESSGKADFEAKCCIYKRILSKKELPGFKTRERFDMCKICAFMVTNHANNAPILTQLYKVAVTAGHASAPVECLFSALIKADAPQRRLMQTKREADLTFLHCEQKTMALK